MVALTNALWPETGRFLSTACINEIKDGTSEDGSVGDGVFQALRQNRYFGIGVPLEQEGLGATLTECSAVQMRIASANLGLAIGLNMHLFTVGVIREHWRKKRDLSCLLLEAIATQDRLVASAFSEPKLGGSILRSHTKGRRTKDGYVVSGTKVPCSLARRSDLVCLQFQSDEPRPDGLLVALVPTKTSGIEVRKTWNASGLLASESDTVVLDECFIHEDLVFHRTRLGEDDGDLFAAGLIWFCMLTTASYVGAMKSALAYTARTMLSSSVPPDGTCRSDVPSLTSAFGEICARIHCLEAAAVGVAYAYDHGSAVQELLPMAIAVKHESAPVCTQAMPAMMELCGSRSFDAGSVLTRLNQDMQAALFHPPTRFVIRHGLAAKYFGRHIRYDLSETR